MYNLAIRKCTFPPLLAPRFSNENLLSRRGSNPGPAEPEADMLPSEAAWRAIAMSDYLKTCSKMNYGLTTVETKKFVYQYSAAIKLKVPDGYTNKIQYLGLTINDKLKLTSHIQKVINRTQPALRTLQYIARKNSQINKETRLHLYKTILRTSLTYGAPLLLNSHPKHHEKLEIIHRKAIRSCLNLKRSYPNRLLEQVSNTPNLKEFIETMSKRYLERPLNKQYMANILVNAPENTTAEVLMNLHNHV